MEYSPSASPTTLHVGPTTTDREPARSSPAKYDVKILVWYEFYRDVKEAIAREKQLKKWQRKWKLKLIEDFNADWADLGERLNQ
jgi:predicted GIY-YIG superfamily endonuclease